MFVMKSWGYDRDSWNTVAALGKWLVKVVCFTFALTLPAVADAAETYPLMEVFACPTLATAKDQARKSQWAAEQPLSVFDNEESVTAAGCKFSQVAITTVDPQPTSDIPPFIAWENAVDANGPDVSVVDYQGLRLLIRTSTVKQEVRYLYGQLTFGDGQTTMGWVEMPRTPYGLVFAEMYRRNPQRAERLIVLHRVSH